MRPNIITVGLSSLGLGLLGGLVPVAAMAIIGDSAVRERRHLAFGALFFWRDAKIVLGLVPPPELDESGGEEAAYRGDAE